MTKASPANPPNRPGSISSAKEERMLDDLEAIFLRNGFRNVTVEHLARQLRCSRRSIYQLAPSKEELFLRIFDRYLSRLRAEGYKNAQGVAPQDAFVRYLQPAIDASRKLSDVVLADMRSYPPANELWVRHRNERMEGLRDLIEHCVAEGIFRRTNPLFVAEVFTASLRSLSDPQFLAASKLSYPEAVTELYGLLLNGLLHAEPPAEPKAAPRRQITLRLQSSAAGGKAGIISQLETMLERLKAGELLGHEGSDDFDYSFQIESTRDETGPTGHTPPPAAEKPNSKRSQPAVGSVGRHKS